jgi:hypothetical protein
VQATRDVPARLGGNGVLIVAEPDHVLSGEAFDQTQRAAKTTLLILPKWRYEADDARKGWIAKAELLDEQAPRAALYSVDAQPKVVRAPAPENFDVNVLSLKPTLSGKVQLAQGAKLKPILATKDGILVGEIRDGARRVVVLSDPDVLENHGIGKGDNAAFARDLFEFLGTANATYVFDETIHGFRGGASAGGAGAPALSGLLLRFPYNLALVEALVGLALLGGATIGRFGAPQAPPRELGLGKRGLIVNIASLINYGGHHGETLRAYVEASARDLAHSLKAPPDLPRRDLPAWLDRLGAARGVARPCSEILDAAEAAGTHDLPRLLEAAQDLHCWKEDIARGAH